MNIDQLIGQTITHIQGEKEDSEIIFTCASGDKFKMDHQQDCCECVFVEDIIGDINDLIGSPILMAEESESNDYQEWETKPEHEYGSFTWTFYKLATAKGYVTIRWHGDSNGYYSESVDFNKIEQ